jgi:hypothetical protein
MRLLMRWLCLAYISVMFTGCTNPLASFVSGPEHVVRAKYEALSTQDMEAYIVTVVPEQRTQITTMNVMASVMTSAFIAVDPLGMNTGGWMDAVAGASYAYQDMQYAVIEQTDDYALVKAQGTLSIGSMANFSYCMYQDVRNVAGTWYNDELAPQKQQRMQMIMQNRMQDLNELAQSTGVDPLFGSADVALLMNPQMWDMLFDLCE